MMQLTYSEKVYQYKNQQDKKREVIKHPNFCHQSIQL